MTVHSAYLLRITQISDIRFLTCYQEQNTDRIWVDGIYELLNILHQKDA